MIRLEQVSKRYGDTIAVNGLSLEVGQGEVCVLVGPSGCGKTTTLRLINRLVEPTAGKIFINGQDITRVKPEALRRTIGYAIQNVGLFPHMTVAANISVVPELLHWKKERITSRVEELLRLVGLDLSGYGGKYPSQLSGGEAQRVGVARALAADPPILLMDEPFGAVDPMTRDKLQAQFLRIQQHLKKSVLLVTHDLDEAIRLADRIAIMQSGKLLQYDTPEVILSRPANRFVHDFVGTDRALKRLSRIRIDHLVKPSPLVSINASAAEVISVCKGCRWVWVVDDGGRLVGWLDREAINEGALVKEAVIYGNPDDIAVTSGATLREALSRMLGQGFKNMPVVDENRRLVGEVTLSDIESATAEPEA